MATLNTYTFFDASSLDFRPFITGEYTPGLFNADTAFEVVLPAFTYRVFGVNFEYNSSGSTVLRGTITDIEAIDAFGGGLKFDLSGISLSVGTLKRVAQTTTLDDDQNLIEGLFSGHDTLGAYTAATHRLSGYFGNDSIFAGGTGTDVFNGGAGIDTVFYLYAQSGVELNLVKGPQGGAAAGDTFISIERFVGTAYGDIMNGSTRNETFDGADSRDILDGGAGNDSLTGGSGKDRLSGGEGRDTIVGGFGDDAIILIKSNFDEITGFQTTNDEIDLAKSEFPQLRETHDDLVTSMFRLGTAARDADDFIIYDKITGRLFFDADGLGGKPQKLIANFEDGTRLSHNDFDLF
ncbi:hypothetical protein BH10PSE7_BH10PSE7_41840 [soil metagenome]